MRKDRIRIAVVGGGIFGITSAVYLARRGYFIDLFERHDDILQEASGLNQYRVHRGYHYPRSGETVLSLLKTEPLFRKEYHEAVIDDVAHYYCIAKEDSLVSPENYLDFCRAYGLEFVEEECDLVNKDKVAVCIRTKESLYDPEKMRKVCWKKLRENGVSVHLGKEVMREDLNAYDFVVTATYANQGRVLEGTPYPLHHQYEVCEKPVVRMPARFNKKSIMIMDGPFMCMDPLGSTGLFVLGNVVHAIHSTNVGKEPEISQEIAPFINRGIVKNPPVTKFAQFKESGAQFIPGLADAEHVGSMFMVRTVLPYQEETDARPTLVTYVNERTINIFSGKIVNCVEAAEKVVHMVERMNWYAVVFRRKFIKSAVSFAVLGGIFYFLWQEAMGRGFSGNFEFSFVWFPAVLSFIFYIFFTFAKAIRLRYFLGKRLALKKAVTVTTANSFWNNILPFRAGELSYLYLLKKTGIVTDGENITSLIVTRLFDVFVVAAFVAFSSLFLFAGGRGGGMASALPLALVITGVFFGLFLLLVFRNNFWLRLLRWCGARVFLPRILKKIVDKGEEALVSLGRLASSRSFFSFFWFSVLVWVGDFLFVWAGLSAAGVSLTFLQAVFIAAFPVIASMIPLQTPAGIGTFEGAVAAGLLALGISSGEALTASILLHLEQLVFTTVLFLSLRLVRNKGEYYRKKI